ncbi:MAG: hypothetical protein KJ728_08725 [Alphaproteobacteria bacterium]|uniref:hypothetical protein n=1 Tax=Brevundimonas sp. TaxID=1871086 RepID=UPI001DA8EBE7|nr:hypothetical protein [Alphaproteobacteria bacterium]MBU1521493.1 hypothetical protein [Alphaproteobacteria bacterium]MBU2231234.1 hypothetical protein [Alphaproteobacteria bacterium]MBU2349450.1 hypothetical protein [Alphaproteobacteria bacterium]MBU2399996.1 hypothetical protein [Alphaproteobacteria bacterium]
MRRPLFISSASAAVLGFALTVAACQPGSDAPNASSSGTVSSAVPSPAAPGPAPAGNPAAPTPAPSEDAQARIPEGPDMRPERIPASEIPCREQIGEAASARLVERCIQVSPATHPPCNAANPCDLIQGEIDRSCKLWARDGDPPAACRS